MNDWKWYIGFKKNKTIQLFVDVKDPTKRRYSQFDHVVGPFESRAEAVTYATEVYYKRRRPNPADFENHKTVIYENIEEIRAEKGKNSLWPKDKFKHRFKRGAQVFGLDNGDLLIKSKNGKKLWKKFNY